MYASSFSQDQVAFCKWPRIASVSYLLRILRWGDLLCSQVKNHKSLIEDGYGAGKRKVSRTMNFKEIQSVLWAL